MLRDFARQHMSLPLKLALPPKQRAYLCRCRRLAQSAPPGAMRGKLKKMRKSGAGASCCAELEYATFQWYVDMMKITTTRIWPKTIKMAATTNIRKLKAIYAQKGLPIPEFPEISNLWVWRFMKRHHIVWRESTVRYKISRAKMLRRSRRTWLQSSKVRYACDLLFGQQGICYFSNVEM